jgi:hypothetical protein
MGCTANQLPTAQPGGLVGKAGTEFWTKNRDLILRTGVHSGMDHGAAPAKPAVVQYGWPQYVVGAFPNTLTLPGAPLPGGPLHAGQAPGTQWYHAHKHGSTSLHIFNGLAGALVELQLDGSQLPRVSGSCLAVLAGSGDTPDEAAIAAFLIEPGQGVTLRRGVWHHPLITVGAADVLVIERAAASEDCQVMAMTTRVEVRLG